MKRMWWSALLVAAGVAPAAAQEVRVEQLDLPRSVAERVVAFFENPRTTVYELPARVGADEVLSGDVGAFGASLTVAGRITGDVMVVEGDLRLEEGGVVGGDVTVIAGRFIGETAAVLGTLTVYEERAPSVRRTRMFDEPRRPRWYYGDGSGTRSRISVRSETSYNRVEGLPVMIGPVIESGRMVQFRLDALAVWRSENGLRFDTDRLGYLVRAEQSVGRFSRFTVGASAHSLVEPIERHLDDFEASLATAVLHRDYRDHFEREGFSIFARAYLPSAGVRLEGEYRDEDHAYVPARDPWTLRHRGALWRPQPLVAQGRLRSVTGRLQVDDRNDRDDPSDGWYLEARATIGLDGELEVPAYLEGLGAPAVEAGAARPVDAEVRAGLLDLRRYTRVGPNSDFRLRGLLAGSVDDKPLPPQFQHALGGEGSLPGHRLFSLDCGARAHDYSIATSEGRLPAFAGYGCDRVALFQAEYRGSFSIDFGYDDDDDDFGRDWYWSPDVHLRPTWSVFFDAARGWTSSAPGEAGYLGPDTETLMDVGVGFYLGDLGLYWAVPLNGEDRGVNFFVRFEHRF